MVYSAAAAADGGPEKFLIKQGLAAALGVALMAIAMRVNYRTFASEPLVWTLLAIVGVMLVAVLFTKPVKGATRWLGVGGLSFQPSELAKLACVLFTAMTLERRMHRINDIAYSLPAIGIVTMGLAGLIFLENDLGTSVSVMLIAAAMVFGAGLSMRYIVGTALVAIPLAAVVLWTGPPFRRARLLAFIDPWADAQGTGFQIIQSLLTVGTGGIFGRGLMESIQKLKYLPEPQTDFIYAVIGEELGLIGTTAILACFCVIAWRGLRIAAYAEDRFGSLTALGVTTMIAVQGFVNMSVVLGLLPTKGIPLPLVSAGGSSMLVSLIGIGILLNISQHQTADA
jgi:cell division protein FtsW